MAEDMEDLVRRVLAIMVHMDARLEAQHEMNARMEARLDRLDAILEEQRTFNARQVEINADVRTTLARLETMLDRLMRPGGNGHEA